MKKVVVVLFLLLHLRGLAQTREDSIRLVIEMSKWVDLDYTPAESDSLLETLKDYREAYAAMHAMPISNQLRFPFAFNPAPPGMKIDTKQLKVEFPLTETKLPANTEDLAFYPITKLAWLIKNRKISSVALTELFLTRLERFGDSLHCVISLTKETAMQQAKKADDDLRKGIYRGPLHGIPYGLKDLFAVKGTKTTWGSAPYKEQVIDEDAFVYTRLKEAGAVLCAKLSMGALAFADLWFGGRTRNPWDLNSGSSGSSAGSAAAVAAGLLPFAIGTETWGSIISPSHTCGVTGLRPSFGSVSRTGAMVLSWSLDKTGPICRNAEDAAIVFYYIKGVDAFDPSATNHAFNYPSTKKIDDLNIAYAGNYFASLPKDAAEWSVINSFRKEGKQVEARDFPDSIMYPADIMNIIISAESAAAFDELTRSGKDDLIERQDKNFWPNIFRSSRFIPAVEYINANRLRSELIRSMNEYMRTIDVLIVPTYAGQQSAITNLTGHPALSIPIGLTKRGVPTSITFIGRLNDEVSILRAAAWFQAHTTFDELHPSKFVH